MSDLRRDIPRAEPADSFRDWFVLNIDLARVHAPDELAHLLRELADHFTRRGWKDYEGKITLDDAAPVGAWLIECERCD